MAKTTFVNGTVVTSTFLNRIFGTSGGHKHTGEDNDGFAQKIDLTTEVSGVLPRANFDHAHSHDGSVEGKVDLANHTSGIVPVGSIPTLPLDKIWNSLTTFNVTFVGFVSDLIVPCIALQSVVTSGAGGLLEITKLFFLGRRGTSNSALFYADLGSISAALRPQMGSDVSVGLQVRDNGDNFIGMARIDEDGAIHIYKNVTSHMADGTFTSSGEKGFHDFSVEYITNL